MLYFKDRGRKQKTGQMLPIARVYEWWRLPGRDCLCPRSRETGELEMKGIEIHATEKGQADDRQAQGVYLAEHVERLPEKLAK